MSRRRSNATSNQSGGAVFRLFRGHRGPVTYVNWQPLAALDVVCDGRQDEPCERLIRYEIEEAGANVGYRSKTISKGVHWVVDEAWTEMTFTCRCGRPSVINLAKVEAVLAGMTRLERRNLRVSSAQLAAIRPDVL